MGAYQLLVINGHESYHVTDLIRQVGRLLVHANELEELIAGMENI